jgi:Immunoglobulin-like domain of bacterial spore germination
MRAWLVTVVFVFACACGGTAPPSRPPQPEPAPEAQVNPKSDLIRVQAPQPGALVQSPLRVTGEARGTWFFEASFPVTLLDSQGRPLVQTHAQARGEWMTEAFVPFESELSFATPATETGTLVLAKDNPSGLPEHADELRVPVRFAPTSP